MKRLISKVLLPVIAMFCMIHIRSEAQEMKVSREINVRNDFAYDILPNVEQNVLFYRDKGEAYYFDIFNSELEFKRSVELTFDIKKVNVNYILPSDTCVRVFYSYKKSQISYIKVNTYNGNADLIDTATIYQNTENLPYYGLKTATSEDKSKIVLFGQVKKQLFLLNFDITSATVLQTSNVLLVNLDVREDFRQININNEGNVFLLFETNNNRYDKEQHAFTVMSSGPDGSFSAHLIQSDHLLNSGVVFEYDNLNRQLILAGLGGEEEDEIQGYFLHQISGDRIPEVDTLHLTKFDAALSREIYGNYKKQKITDYSIKDIVLKNDGGCVLFAEMKKEYLRRSSFPTRFDGETYSQRGFIDHYNEDIIAINTDKNGKLLWRKVLYKKQFSQDDEGVFSSFFIFKTPSRIHLIYNDEIKSNSTISEYVLDPLGNYERNTLFNTESQNLKLRFLSSVQTGSNSLIVPSEKSYKINLVKIIY